MIRMIWRLKILEGHKITSITSIQNLQAISSIHFFITILPNPAKLILLWEISQELKIFLLAFRNFTVIQDFPDIFYCYFMVVLFTLFVCMILREVKTSHGTLVKFSLPNVTYLKSNFSIICLSPFVFETSNIKQSTCNPLKI